jgi:putative transposase
MRKLLKKYAFVPERLVTTTFDHMAPVIRYLGTGDGRTTERRIRINRRGGGNARCSASRAKSAQKFLSSHAVVYNTFNVKRHLT